MAHERPTNAPGYEVADPPVRTIVYSALGLAAFTVLVCIVLAWCLRFLIAMESPGERNPLAPSNQLPPEPRVEVRPWEQIRELRTREEQTLDSYGWVDREKGIVRIPIDRAIDLTMERGLPVRKEAPKK